LVTLPGQLRLSLLKLGLSCPEVGLAPLELSANR
jgi:hypothetical protein